MREYFRQNGIYRLAFAAVFTIFGSVGILALTISGIARTKNPDLALRSVPFEPIALAAKADRMFFDPSGNRDNTGQDIALRAIEIQSLNARALRVLGYYKEANGDERSAAQLINYAGRLSRRDPGVQLWLIQHSGRTRNVTQILKHYDILLRTKSDIEPEVFSRLVQIIGDPTFQKALVPYIVDNRDWAVGFLAFASANTKDSNAVADTIIAAGGFPKSDRLGDTAALMLTRLVREGHVDKAVALYSLIEKSDDLRSSNGSFKVADVDGRFGALGWQLPEYPDSSAVFTAPKSSSPSLSISTNSYTTRTVATRLLFLAPGRYRLDSTLAELDLGVGGGLSWKLRCGSSSEAVLLSSFEQSRLVQSFQVNVPNECKIQQLELVASGGATQSGLTAEIESVSFTRINKT